MTLARYRVALWAVVATVVMTLVAVQGVAAQDTTDVVAAEAEAAVEETVEAVEDATDEVAADDTSEATEEETPWEVTFNGEEEVDLRIGAMHFMFANLVRIEEAIDADLVSAGYRVDVNETVDGDVFAAAQDVVIDGIVEGSVRAAGQSVTINGTVRGNVLAAGNSITLGENAVVEGHVNLYGAAIVLEGDVQGRTHVGGAFTTVDGLLGQEAILEGEEVEFLSGAVLNGEVTVKGPTEPIFDEAVAQDNVTYEYVDYAAEGDKVKAQAEWSLSGAAFGALIGSFSILSILYKIVAMGLVGVLLIWLFPEWTRRVSRHMMERPGPSWGYGGAAFLLFVPAVIALAFSVVGWSLLGLLVVVFGLLMWFGPLFLGMLIGDRIFKEKKDTPMGERLWHFVVGYAILTVVVAIPVLGWLAGFLAALWGMGSVLASFAQQKQK